VQSLQFYVRHPGASGGTTAARAGVNASFEAPYHRRVFVEGFVQPRVEAADGATVTEDVAVTGFQTIDAILVEVPRSALGDLSGAQFVPLVLGQDGFSYGSVRPVAATATDGVFGGGAGSGTRDSTNPNVIDLITPEGVTQAQALAYDASSNAEIPYIQL
jgi:carbohydrate-binding DOMON domain-containing protein